MSEESTTIETNVKSAWERLQAMRKAQKDPTDLKFSLEDYKFFARTLGLAYRKAYEVQKVAGAMKDLA